MLFHVILDCPHENRTTQTIAAVIQMPLAKPTSQALHTRRLVCFSGSGAAPSLGMIQIIQAAMLLTTVDVDDMKATDRGPRGRYLSSEASWMALAFCKQAEHSFFLDVDR